VSQFMTLNVGDIFLMGTPSGVGPVFYLIWGCLWRFNRGCYEIRWKRFSKILI
jgi:2-keto-4-pentenoate hydratase/2-oxohepta-3-ene-1,7-dioic acid hydratase in catechol pathway